MTRVLVIALLCALHGVAAADPDREPDPRWWQEVAGWVGYRSILAIDDASGATFGVAYRVPLGGWGVDLALLNVQYGIDEGIHTLFRLDAYLELDPWVRQDLWFAVGASYGREKGWVGRDTVPRRAGEGYQIDMLLGWEVLDVAVARVFAQATVTLPLYRLYDQYRSTDSATYAPGFELALGLRL